MSDRMSKEQFDIQIRRLIDCYGDKTFNDQRLMQFFTAVKDLPYLRFVRIVDHIIRNQRYAPLPKDFYEAARGERNAMHSENRYTTDSGFNHRYEPDCPLCGDTGELDVVEKGDPNKHTWVIACKCRKGAESVWHTKHELQRLTPEIENRFNRHTIKAGPAKARNTAELDGHSDPVQSRKQKVFDSIEFWRVWSNTDQTDPIFS